MTQFIVSNPNGTVTAGVSFPLTITPEDQFNNATTYSPNVTVTSSNVLDGATAGSNVVLGSTTVAAINNNTAKLFLKAANNLTGQTPRRSRSWGRSPHHRLHDRERQGGSGDETRLTRGFGFRGHTSPRRFQTR